MRTADVNAALRRHYKAAEYALMFEVSNGTGMNARRHADAVVMNLWPSRGLLIEGIEVKVSRSDWRRELDNPAKAEPVAQYCDRWWVVAPENIVHEHELPALWGHMVVLDGGKIVVKKPAPRKTEVKALDRHFVAAMLRRASGADASEVEAAVRQRMAEFEKQFDDRVERAAQRRTREAEHALKKLAMLKEAGVDPDRIWDSKELAAQMSVGQKLSSIGHNLKYQIDTLKKAAEDLTGFAAMIGTKVE